MHEGPQIPLAFPKLAEKFSHAGEMEKVSAKKWDATVSRDFCNTALYVKVGNEVYVIFGISNVGSCELCFMWLDQF